MSGEIIHDAGSHLFPRSNGGGSGSRVLYTVEIRSDYSGEPEVHGNFVIDREWRTLPISIGFPGIPNRTLSHKADEMGLLSWPAANALRWWAHAQFGGCLQSRIVKHLLKEEYSDTILGYYDIIGGGGANERTRMTHSPITEIQTEAIPHHTPSKV